MKYVMIGNSAAAVGCIEGIRSVDPDGEITVVSSEPYHTYSRPLISYLLLGKTDLQRMKYRPDNFYETNGCKVLLGKTVQAIDAQEKRGALESGEVLPYDKLLVATGSRPFVPPMEGLDTVPEKFTFLSLDDAKKLEQALGKDKRVLIVGAGLIGLKCAEGILNRVGSITVVDLANRVLPSILNEEGSAMVQAHLESLGLSFLLSDSVQRFDGTTAYLKSGKTVEFDVLVVAVGVRPNTELVKEAGGEVRRGIATDLHCATTLPDVYAAGDCSECYDLTTGQNRVLALLPNAYMQGRCAGVNMAGTDSAYDTAIPMNAIGFLGLHMITAGAYEGEAHIVRDSGSYKALFCRDNRLMGFILIGDVARAGIYTSLIRNQTPLDTIDFELVMEKPQLMAFTKAARTEMMAK